MKDLISPASILESISEAGIRYVLLTDFEGIWSSKKTLELDVYVPSIDRKLFCKIISELGFLQRRKPADLPNHNFFFISSGKSQIILDVRFSFSFYDKNRRLWIASAFEKIAISNQIKNNGVFRPQGFICLLLYSAHCGFLERGRLEERHIIQLEHYIELFYEELNNQQKSFADELLISIHKTSLDELPSVIKNLIQPYFNRYYSLRFYWRTFILKISSWGLGNRILFLGPDGVGKSSLVNQIKARILLKTEKLYLGIGNSDYILPIFPDIKSLSNHRKMRKLFSFVFWNILLPIELGLRRIKVAKNGRYRMILIDRFPGKPFITSKCYVRKIYQLILPKPDLIVLLTGDPEIIAARKPDETSAERTEQEIEKWHQVANNLNAKSTIIIDTTKNNLSVCTDQVITEICNNSDITDRLLKSPYD